MSVFKILLTNLLLTLFIVSTPTIADTTIKIMFTPELPTQFFTLNSTFCQYGKPTLPDKDFWLSINTMTSAMTWNQCFKTQPGILQAGKNYAISFKCKTLELGNDSSLLFLIRPLNAQNNYSDLITEVNYEVSGNEPRQIQIRCQIPSGRNDYALQIHTQNKARALIGPITIRETKTQLLIPPPGNTPPSANYPPNISGAQEFTVDLPADKKKLTINAADFNVTPANPDNTAALNAAIAHCYTVNASKLVLSKGIYHFNSEPSIAFKQLCDFEFDGNGSTLVFLKKNDNPLIEITNCTRILFKNFNVDWDWTKDPLASVVKVENIDKNREYADFRFVDYQKFPNPNTRFILLDMLDPQNRSVGCDSGFAISLQKYIGRGHLDYQWLSGNLLRIKIRNDKLQLGQLFRMSHYYYHMNGFSMYNNTHLTIQNVNVYSCPGHAFLAGGDQHHWQLLHTNIIRPPGSTRPITCTADHHHIAQSKGYLKIENCEFSFGNDDCLNIHDCSAYGIKTGDKTMTFSNLSNSYHPGDIIEFRNEDYSPTGKKINLNSIKQIGNNWVMEFAKPIPGANNTNLIIFNRRYDSHNIIVRNNYFHDNRARGLLLLGRDITVENNRFFRNQMGGIKIETGYTIKHWCEGYGVSNVVIRNNIFDSVNPHYSYANEMQPAIYMSVYLKNDPSTHKTDYPILNNILVENNKFINCPGAIVYACSAHNIVIRNNNIENNVPWLRQLPHRGMIGIAYASNIFITGNIWIASKYISSPGLMLDQETVKDAFCWDNQLIKK